MTDEIEFKQDTLILDTSCLIGLYASRQIENILRTIPSTVTIATYVYEQEALWIYDGPENNIRQTKGPINLQPLIDADLIKIVALSTDAENELYVDLAVRLDDGEAITGAIAIHRNWTIALDDRKAHNLLARDAPHIQVVSTLELVKYWGDQTTPSFETVAVALRNIRYRAVYLPSKNHPLRDWWYQYLPE